MKFFAYLKGLLNKAAPSEATTQDANLPLHINFKTTITFEVNPFVSAITQGAMVDVKLDNLKMLRVQAISSLKIAGMEDKKFHRFYFESSCDEKRLFLQTLSAANNPQAIEEILFCSSVTEVVESVEDIEFFTGENELGLGAQTYTFSRADLVDFLPKPELDKRLGKACTELEFIRSEADEMEFMSALTGSETRIFDANGTRGESVKIMNFMPHTRSLSGAANENFMVAFWVTTSKDGKNIARDEQLPLAEYIFAIKLEQKNINVI
jgi:hypothetical protein